MANDKPRGSTAGKTSRTAPLDWKEVYYTVTQYDAVSSINPELARRTLHARSLEALST